jgi:hypothetical protein
MSSDAPQKSRITVAAIVYPACVCGRPYPAHFDEGTPSLPEGCSGYRPSRPVKDLGIISEREA